MKNTVSWVQSAVVVVDQMCCYKSELIHCNLGENLGLWLWDTLNTFLYPLCVLCILVATKIVTVIWKLSQPGKYTCISSTLHNQAFIHHYWLKLWDVFLENPLTYHCVMLSLEKMFFGVESSFFYACVCVNAIRENWIGHLVRASKSMICFLSI